MHPKLYYFELLLSCWTTNKS